MGKTALVTGAAGFTGGYLCRNLLQHGYRVRGLLLPGTDDSSLRKTGVEIVYGDLCRRETLAAAVSGVDIVYHIAAVYREENIPRKMFWDVNVDGTRNLLEAARDAGVKRFVHCSTVGVQGEIKNPPATEEHPYNPGDYYQESKLEGERLALAFFREHRLPGVVFRPVGIYGPGDTRFLKIFRHINSGAFRMFGSGKVLYHLTYVEDLAEGIRLVGETPGIEGEVITLAGERYTTLNEFVGIVGQVLGRRISRVHIPVWPLWIAGAVCEGICYPFKINPPIYRRRVEFFMKDRAFSIAKAQRLLGYAPKVSLREGLSRTAEWYRKEGLLT
ncbi:NAD-dependent epimerase/dehydratase family protein [bacterium]|nr:NAD-dependent epimerase/dehydratase family protein [bacterium]